MFWAGGRWVERFADAELFDDEDAALAAEAHAKSQITVVVDPYLIDVDPVGRRLSRRSAIASACARSGRPTSPSTASRPRAATAIEALLHAHGAARSKGRRQPDQA